MAFKPTPDETESILRAADQLDTLPKFGEDLEHMRKRVLAAILHYCDNVFQAVAVINHLSLTAERYPISADIQKAVIAIANEQPKIETIHDPQCVHCAGSGFISKDRMINGVPYPYAIRCPGKRVPKPRPSVEDPAPTIAAEFDLLRELSLKPRDWPEVTPEESEESRKWEDLL